MIFCDFSLILMELMDQKSLRLESIDACYFSTLCM
jgi:hypothetical protein